MLVLGSVQAKESLVDKFQFLPEELEETSKIIKIRSMTIQLINAFRYNQEAVPRLLRTLEHLDPQSSEYHYFRALDDYRHGKKIESFYHVSESLKHNERYDSALNLAGLIMFEADRHEEARDYFKSAFAVASFNPTYAYNLANANYRLKNYQSALSAIQRAISIRPNFTEAYYLKGKILIAAGKDAKALPAFQGAKNLGYSNARFYHEYITAARSAERDDLIAALLPDLLKFKDPTSRRMYADLSVSFGEYKAAFKIYSELIVEKDAADADVRKYIYYGHKLGYPKKTIFRRIRREMLLKNNYDDYYRSIQEVSTQFPTMKDAILNPAR